MSGQTLQTKTQNPLYYGIEGVQHMHEHVLKRIEETN
jgi:hypothetical protein